MLAQPRYFEKSDGKTCREYLAIRKAARLGTICLIHVHWTRTLNLANIGQPEPDHDGNF